MNGVPEREHRLRVAVCDDSLLFREGLVRVLADLGFDVVGVASNPDELVELVESVPVDLVLVDVRMPPTHTDEGIRVALELAELAPTLGVLVLSQHVETSATIELLRYQGAGRGYLLKDRVADLDAFVDVLHRVGRGESAVDPEVAVTLITGRRAVTQGLSSREVEILALMAEGRSNTAICDRLVLSPRTVESHVRTIFRKLDLSEEPDDNRRVLAVLAYLR